jgi:hypothetical protein
MRRGCNSGWQQGRAIEGAPPLMGLAYLLAMAGRGDVLGTHGRHGLTLPIPMNSFKGLAVDGPDGDLDRASSAA